MSTGLRRKAKMTKRQTEYCEAISHLYKKLGRPVLTDEICKELFVVPAAAAHALKDLTYRHLIGRARVPGETGKYGRYGYFPNYRGESYDEEAK